ncbi:taste receptor type 2 member 125-like [Aythya fuligula]|uniref:Taste receptor type 2 n=1 Tax=Aythya fuligula TaxID=219594 RepID=A0A6J3CMX9_AYTFU|nr:taste receptor type 2 member 125-like [Aythya fuligula]
MEASHSQQQFNATSYDITIMVVITLQAFAGMWINAFIVAVSCLTWVKKKSFNSSEKILLFLGCSRFWFLCVTWAYTITSTLFHWQTYIRRVPRIFAPLLCISNSFNLWFSTCLYVFYCIKIANFRYIFFIYLKVKIDRIVPWLLLGSVVLSLVMCSPVFDSTNQVSCCNLNSTSLEYFRKLNEKINKQYSSIFYICGFGFSVAFIIVIFSALLLLFSLWRHKSKMQTSSAKDLSMDAHIKAMKSLLSFFIIYGINFICLILTMIYPSREKNPMTFLFLVLQYTFPSVHSLILIFSSPKLEKIVLRILPCVKRKLCMC